MPYAPKRPCRFPNCPKLCDGKEVYCADHRQLKQETYRGSASTRGYNAQWRKERSAFLKRYPLCVECQRNGRLTPATVVDHIIPHRGDMRLFWDTRNWQPLCKPCHDHKTGTGR